MSELAVYAEQEHYADDDDNAEIYMDKKCSECGCLISSSGCVKDKDIKWLSFCSEGCKEIYLPF